ncbi:MAG: Cell division protein FtsZ [Lentisphaerae bacterium ADurb.Bin242]|nr:MAG: Cell division protein FtsZ [Lentisphaerae bacterium ADurb.Bin242]
MSETQEKTLFQEPAAPPSAPEQGNKKILIVGIGGCGAKVLKVFTGIPGSNAFDLLLVDTDKDSMVLCPGIPAIHPEANWTTGSGLGCGGDPMKGERAIARERARLTQSIGGHDFLVAVGGLGGGTATGGVHTIASVVKNLSIPSVFLLTTPFSFESYTKRNNAEQCLKDLRSVTEALVPLPNDLLFSTLPPDTSVEDAFEKASLELAASVFGVAELFRSKKLIGPDFAEFSATLKKGWASCAFGVGRASSDDGLDRCSLALERMLESPFLGGMDRLNSSNAVIVTMTGGPDLQIAEMKRTLENMTSLLPGGVRISAGVTINPDYHSMVQVSTLAIRYDPVQENSLPQASVDSPWISPPARSATSEKSTFEQGLLNLQSYSKGIFANVAPAKYKDEDLDIPTFQRRGISIDKGSTGK